MASKFAVSAIFEGFDRVSAPLRKANKSLRKFGKRAKITSAQVRFANKSITRSFRRTALSILGVSSALFVVKSLTVDSIKRITSFNAVLTSAGQKFGGIERGTEVFKELEASAKQLGATTEFTALQSAKGLEFFATAGFNAQLAMKGLKASANFATAAGVQDLALVADKLSDSLGLFQLKTDDPEQFVKNLTRISDVIIATSNAANTSVTQFFDAIPKGSAGLKNLGISLEQFSGLIASLSDQVKGAEAGVAIRNIVAALTTTTKLKSGKALKNLIGDVEDLDTGNLKNMPEIIDRLNKATANMGSLAKARALGKIFPKRTLTSMVQLLNVGGDKLRFFQKQFENVSGTTRKQAEIMRKELSVKFLILNSTFQAFVDTIMVKVTPAIETLVDALTKMFSTLGKAGGFVTLMKSVASATQVNEWGKLAVSIVGVAAAFGAIFLSIQSVVAGIKLLTIALDLLTETNPLLLALAAVLFVTFEIIQNLDTIKAWFDNFKTEDLSKTIRGNIQGGLFGDLSGVRFFGKKKTEDLTAVNDPSTVITLPQNMNRISSEVNGAINVTFNNAPKNMDAQIVSGATGLNLSQSGAP